MPLAVGQLDDGAFLSNDFGTLVANAQAAMVTIESESGAEMMSSAMALRGGVALIAKESSAEEASEPSGRIH